MARGQGKWSEPNVPHKGWSCVDVEDLGSPDAVCEMCETQEIRYVHYMTHPDHHETLGVGCVCAEHMEEDYEAPRRRERQLRNSVQRKQRWLRRKWRISNKGNAYLNTDGFNITVFRKPNGTWGGTLIDRRTNQSVSSRRVYRTEDQAKLAAFDAMIFLKNERGWGA
ncbi:hypothetical protein ACTU44_14760 [Thalassospira sp. SM2505]